MDHVLKVCGFCLLLCAHSALAQSGTLNAPSRTIYKCVVGKKISYSDQPCLGAERLDIDPSRGLNKLSGKELTGRDVANERHREAFAEAIKPLSGLSAAQFEVHRRRLYLPSTAKAQCTALDTHIARLEATEKNGPRDVLAAVQRELFVGRQRYAELKC